MGIEEEFARRFRKEHGVHARYAAGSLRLGEVGRMQDGVFVPTDFYPWVAAFGEAPAHEPSSQTLAVGSVTQRALGAHLKVPGLESVVLARAGAQFTFGSTFSALVVLKGVRVRRVERLEALWRELLRRQRLPKTHPEHFDPDLRVVTAVSQVDEFWIYAGREKGAQVVLEATADVPHFDLAQVGADFAVKYAETALAHTQGRNSTPLFQLAGITRSLPFTAYRGAFLSGPTSAGAAPREVAATTVESGSLEALHAAASASTFDHLFVVSDLHVGGDKTKNMHPYTDDVAMGWLGDELARRAETERICWVVAGDIIDFLAYPDPTGHYFHPPDAIRRLNQIAQDNPETFRAWGTFAAAGPNATLVFLLGNHDLELGLSAVWEKFTELVRLHAKQPALQLARPLAGVDFRCVVGGQRVCVKHGNESDEWNVVDYDRLTEFDAGDSSWPRWRPNDGTALVVDHMNSIKQDYPFVDLLKPEDGAVQTILAPLLPTMQIIENVGAAKLQRDVTKAKQRTGRVGGDEETVAPVAVAPGPAISGHELVTGALRALDRGAEPLDLVNGPGSLGLGRYIAGRLFGSQEDAAYDAVLENLGDTAFDVRATDAYYDWFTKNFPDHTNVLVVGHTHLAKLIHRTTNTVYVNSGTWMPLIDLPEILAEGRSSFDALFAALREKSLEALDQKQFLIRRRTVVHVGPDRVELCSVRKTKDRADGPVVPGDALTLASVAALTFGGAQ